MHMRFFIEENVIQKLIRNLEWYMFRAIRFLKWLVDDSTPLDTCATIKLDSGKGVKSSG